MTMPNARQQWGDAARLVLSPAVLLVLVLASCTPPGSGTVALRSWAPPEPDQEGPGYRYGNLAAGNNSDSLFVCLAFSGGGTRAAALAYGVMEELRATHIVWDGTHKTLLDEVDCISSVSGGSFTAAYYGLFKERLFTDFRSAMLEQNIQGQLLAKVLIPTNWFWLASPYFSRIDVAADLYDSRLFDHLSYKALHDRGKPFVIINATNMGSGARFPFTQDQVDLIGSDLDSYRVARVTIRPSARSRMPSSKPTASSSVACVPPSSISSSSW
jgi:NTE family protein